MQIQTIAFSGRLTPEIRRQLRQHRQALGLSLHALAQFFRVSWATIRKWECGQARSCTVKFIPLIGAFLRGEYDSHLREQMDAEHSLLFLQPPPVVQECLAKIASVYDLCDGDAKLQAELLAQIHALSRAAIQQSLRERGTAAPH